MTDAALDAEVRAILIVLLLCGATVAAIAAAVSAAIEAEQTRLDSMSPPILSEEGEIHA
jgi:hypothetical protein